MFDNMLIYNDLHCFLVKIRRVKKYYYAGCRSKTAHLARQTHAFMS